MGWLCSDFVNGASSIACLIDRGVSTAKGGGFAVVTLDDGSLVVMSDSYQGAVHVTSVDEEEVRGACFE